MYLLKGNIMFNFAQIVEDFQAAIAVLEQVLPSIGALVVAVHPAAGQEAAKVTTALATANSVLTAAGVTASTVSALAPAITAVVQGNATPASVPSAQTAS